MNNPLESSCEEGNDPILKDTFHKYNMICICKLTEKQNYLIQVFKSWIMTVFRITSQI